MKNEKHTSRLRCAVAFSAVLIIIIVIALFVRDRFIRPYGGDILVTVLLCLLVRIFFPCGVRLLPLWVFLFAVLVEIGQYFNIVDLLGLGHVSVIRIAVGTSFSWVDILCYAVGCAIFAAAELLAKRSEKAK